jgi:indole-3-glycerol phosphate synthase
MNSDFLSQIVARKRQDVENIRAENTRDEFRQRALQLRQSAAPHRFISALKANSPSRKIIAEFKRRSPSAGGIRANAAPTDLAIAYERGGACAISVLTDPEFFGGSIDDLVAIRYATQLPILQKDFIIDGVQIYEAAIAGADAVLLIVAALDNDSLGKLRAIAEDELGLDALVEVHSAVELDRAINAGAKIVGVNNRNLQTLQVSLSTSEELIAHAPPNRLMVSESGLESAESLLRLQTLGFHGFLIGEALMRAADPEKALRGLIATAEQLMSVTANRS